MPATLETFALRFARQSPPLEHPGEHNRISSIKGMTRMTRVDLARIAAGGVGINPFAFTMPQTTQFGPVPDTGHSDWDAE
jgi:hypothetical protein